MKNLCVILPSALILCFMVGCQDKEAMAELKAMKARPFSLSASMNAHIPSRNPIPIPIRW